MRPHACSQSVRPGVFRCDRDAKRSLETNHKNKTPKYPCIWRTTKNVGGQPNIVTWLSGGQPVFFLISNTDHNVPHANPVMMSSEDLQLVFLGLPTEWLGPLLGKL